MATPLQDLSEAFNHLANSINQGHNIRLDQFCEACRRISPVLRHVSTVIDNEYAGRVSDLSGLSGRFATLEQVSRDRPDGWKLHVVNRSLRYANLFFDHLVNSRDWNIGTAAERAYDEVYAEEGNILDWLVEKGLIASNLFGGDLVSAVGERNSESINFFYSSRTYANTREYIIEFN